MSQQTDPRAQAIAAARNKAAAVTPAAKLAELQAMFKMREAALTQVTGNAQRTNQLFSLILGRCSRQPDLLTCDPLSLYLSVQKIAALGLSPMPERKHFYLVPYKNADLGNVKEATLQVSYHGMVYLARAHPEVEDVWADVVYKGEEFHYDRFAGTISHKVGVRDGTSEADMVHAYAVVRLRSGKNIFEVMSRDDVMRRRAKAQSKAFWSQWPQEMWCKTAIRKLLNGERVPKKDALSEALGLDDEIVAPAEFTVSDAAEDPAPDLPESTPAQLPPPDPTPFDVVEIPAQAEPEPVLLEHGEVAAPAQAAPAPSARSAKAWVFQVQEIAEAIGIGWDEIAAQTVKLCGGKPPADWESLTRLQCDRLKPWLEKRAQGGAAQ